MLKKLIRKVINWAQEAPSTKTKYQPKLANDVSRMDTYSAIGGADIKVLIDGEEQGGIQAISLHYDAEAGYTKGSIVGLVMVDDPDISGMFDKKFDIVIIGTSEYGGGVSMRIPDVELLDWNAGVSVDDIMLDESVTYKGGKPDGWKSLKFVDARTEIK